MKSYKGKLLAEITLFCKGQPLPRGRSFANFVAQPLENQAEMISQLKAHSHLQIDVPVWIDIDCGYKRFFYGSTFIRYDVDNIMKGVLDNLQRMFIIKDDYLVIGSSIVKHQATDDTIDIKIYKAKGYGTKA